VPASIGRPGSTPYHRLNPLTKLVAAVVTGVEALALGGFVGPAILVAVAVLLPAAVAGVVRPLLRTTLFLSLPIGVSVVIVNVLFFPGGQDVLFQVGPVTATREGLLVAGEVLLRIVAISGAITLYYLTTPPGDLTIDLERRGVSPRIAFVANASLQTVPAMVERAAAITAAQRARGLDTEGSLRARLRGVIPIAGPVVLGAIGEVEERTMALEARGFSRPGRRTLLWRPPDSGIQRAARWLMALAIPAVVAARAAGVL
jgi:energy-coupling factor transport system permease protein